ncbi:MAG: alpha/beta hydrolase [Ruminococcus sp.]|nr:alpha/beta hydrolase [Ruminococcus sp.]
MIDGEGEDTALVFYPGAKVDSEAYLPLMKKLAENGIDCFLLKAPMRIAIFDMNAAERIIDKYDYQTWLLSGHSMGGIAAAGCAAENSDVVDGVVLLASYPNNVLGDDISLLSIYGTEDMVLGRDAYEKAKSNYPSNSQEVVITGGNHAQFGNYGRQSGDGEATITREEQQEKTVAAILDFVQKYDL